MSIDPAPDQMTVDQAVQLARSQGLQGLDAQLLLLHALEKPPDLRAWLRAHGSERLSDTVQALFRACVSRRLSGEPVAYVVGQREFYGLPLTVDRRVLVPRPETETLVDWALEVLQARPGARVLDLGTGSGAIALALKQQRKDLDVSASDASPDALEVARFNAHKLGLDVCFLQGDWLQPAVGRYDLIVANPPYVREGDPHLTQLACEPAEALVSGPDGLDDLREIIAAAGRHLLPAGWLIVEHGYDQAARVRALLHSAGFQEVGSRRDLAGIQRCSAGLRH
jgi:release factor glutamine methyltransferase